MGGRYLRHSIQSAPEETVLSVTHPGVQTTSPHVWHLQKSKLHKQKISCSLESSVCMLDKLPAFKTGPTRKIFIGQGVSGVKVG